MDFNFSLLADITVPIATLFFGAWLHRKFESRSKLTVYLGHVAAHIDREKEPSLEIYTHEIVLINQGRKSATNVRLSHHYLPSYSIYPDVQHTVQALKGGGKEIIIPRLVPNKQVRVSYLYFPPILYNQINDSVESDEGMADLIQVMPVKQYPAWLYKLLGLFFVVGVIFTGYMCVSLLFNYLF